MQSKCKLAADLYSADVVEFFGLLEKHEVQYLVVGGEAVIFHGYPRLTGDIDFFYTATEENVQKLFDALAVFWSGLIPEVRSPHELLEPGLILQFGRPPHRIDLMNAIDGVDFQEAWNGREEVELTGAELAIIVPFLGKTELLKNKAASGRAKDLDDIDHLQG